jgi:hypothetical protein
MYKQNKQTTATTNKTKRNRQAEIHGCGQAAREKARSDWLKQSNKVEQEKKAAFQEKKPVAGKMKAVKQAYLKQQLQKKIDAQKSERTKKKPESDKDKQKK